MNTTLASQTEIWCKLKEDFEALKAYKNRTNLKSLTAINAVSKGLDQLQWTLNGMQKHDATPVSQDNFTSAVVKFHVGKKLILETIELFKEK